MGVTGLPVNQLECTCVSEQSVGEIVDPHKGNGREQRMRETGRDSRRGREGDTETAEQTQSSQRRKDRETVSWRKTDSK